MALSRTLVGTLLACFVFGTLTTAQETPRQHPLTNLPPSGEISTGFFFPDFPTKHFPAGEVVKVVLGIRNEASEKYNVSAIMGSLNSPIDFSKYFYNFTQKVYFQLVEPGQELSVEYAFVPPKELPAMDYQVALTVFYEAADGFKSSTFFNQTIEVVEVKKLIDTELITLYVILLSLMAAGGWYVWDKVKSQFKGALGGGKKSKKVETSRADTDDEWVKGTPYDAFRKKKAAAASVPKSPGKSKAS